MTMSDAQGKEPHLTIVPAGKTSTTVRPQRADLLSFSFLPDSIV